MHHETSPFILFITGASGAGKTAVYERLRETLGCPVHEIDEDGVPEDRGRHWADYRMEQLLYKAIAYGREGKPCVIGGIIFPHDVIESRYYKRGLNVHYILLYCNKETITERLKNRLLLQGRRTGWRPLAESNTRVTKRLRNQVESQKNHLLIDTGKHNETAVTDLILGYVRGLPGGHNGLPKL